MSHTPAPVPDTLAKAGSSAWKSVAAKYELRPDEMLTLEDACAITDMIAALSKSWNELGKPLTTKGSMGQEVIHPLIGEIRAQRAARNALWRQLKLPDLDAAAGPKVNAQREGGNTRWANAHGR